jgi:hypothetical protein
MSHLNCIDDGRENNSLSLTVPTTHKYIVTILNVLLRFPGRIIAHILILLLSCFLLRCGQSAVVRLVGAIIKTLKDLVQAGTTTSSSTSSLSASASSSSLPSGSMSTSVGGGTKDVLQVTLPDSVTRIILILWQCPANANTTLSEESFFRLMRLFLRLPSSQSAKVLSALESYPSHLFASRLLKPLQEHLSLQMLTGTSTKSRHHLFYSPLFYLIGEHFSLHFIFKKLSLVNYLPFLVLVSMVSFIQTLNRCLSDGYFERLNVCH